MARRERSVYSANGPRTRAVRRRRRHCGGRGTCARRRPCTRNDTAYRITGPEALSYDDVATLLGVRHVSLSADELTAHLGRHGIPEAYAQLLASLDVLIATGAEAEVSDAVERVTGRPPRSFHAFLRG